MRNIIWGHFEWDLQKELKNIEKHGISFEEAALVFADSQRMIIQDELHSFTEERFFCIGRTTLGVLTVRFVVRKNLIRIIGAGRWRKGEKIYEKNKRE